MPNAVPTIRRPLSAALFCTAAALLLCVRGANCQQQAEWRFFGVEDGLSGPYTSGVSICRDGQVYISHGETTRLGRLDGWPAPDGRFVRYSYEVNGNGHVYESGAGQLWVFSADNAYLYRDGGLTRYTVDEIDSLASRVDEDGPKINARILMLPGEKDSFFFLLPQSLGRFDIATGRRAVAVTAEDIGLGRFIDMNIDAADNIWLTAERGVCRLTRQAGGAGLQWQAFPLLSTGLRNFQTLSCAPDGELVAVGVNARSGRKEMVHFDGTGWRVLTGYSGDVIKGWPGQDSSFWAVKEHQALSLILGGKEKVQEKSGLLSGELFDVAVGEQGVFWLATSHGLARYTPPIWRTPLQVRQVDSRIHSICEDRQGGLWFAAVYQLLHFQDDHWTIYPLPKGVETHPYMTQSISSLPDGRIAIGTLKYQDSLLTFDPVRESFGFVPHPQQVAIRKSDVHYIRLIAPRRDGTLWVETHPAADSSVFRLEVYDGHSFRHFLDVNQQSNISNLRYLYETESGDLWIASTFGNGIALYRKGQFRSFGPADGYTGGSVFCICEVANGRVWVGGRDAIQEYDGERWSLVRSGLASVRSIVRGKDGTVWVGSGNGIHRWRDGAWVTNSIEDGLPNTAVFSIFQDSRGRIWAGTIGGLSLYHPEADSDPPLTFVPENENLRETPPDGEVRLIFSGADRWKQTRTERLLYSCRLDSGEWSQFKPGNVAVYNKLPYGPHRFEVRAIDANLNVTPEPAGFGFTVLVPWYRELGFQIIISVGGAVILILLGYAVHRHVLLEKLVIERTRDLQRQHSSLEVMLKHQSLLAAIASRMSSAVSFQAAVEEIMQAISERMGLDEVFLLDPVLSGAAEQDGGEKCAPDAPEGSEKTFALTPWLLQRIRQSGCFVAEDVCVMEPDRRDFFLARELGSICIFPVLISGQVVRLVCFGRRERYDWKPEEIEFFQTATDIITSAWERFCHFQARLEAEKKQGESIQMAEKASRLASIGVIAAGITHEINQPLNDIKAVSDTVLFWLRKNAGLIPEQYEKLLLSISGSVGRISRIISQMRSYWASPGGGRTEIISLNKAVHSALLLIRGQLDSHGINLALDEKDKSILVQANKINTEQIVLNLMVNAIHALDTVAGRDKKIRIRLYQVDGVACLAVEDNGPGVPAELREKLFDPFFTTRKPEQGMGLGLAIVKRFAEEFGGRVRVSDSAAGGAVFTVEIPLVNVN